MSSSDVFAGFLPAALLFNRLTGAAALLFELTGFVVVDRDSAFRLAAFFLDFTGELFSSLSS